MDNSTDAIADTDPASLNGDGTIPLDIGTAALGAHGALLRRVINDPLSFTFTWRDIDFKGSFEGREDCLRMIVRCDLASLPYSVEDAVVRDNLLAVVDASGDEPAGKLWVIDGQQIVLRREIEIPMDPVSTVDSIVSALTVLVLRAAPYLDLLAERAVDYRDRTKAQIDRS